MSRDGWADFPAAPDPIYSEGHDMYDRLALVFVWTPLLLLFVPVFLIALLVCAPVLALGWLVERIRAAEIHSLRMDAHSGGMTDPPA